ncbi:nigrin b-like [Ricinus communis]|uniref:nigrin b-like n=1 Tax=Ricinus communis TaxID=3988 RepID=UPI000772C48F|nr:nigrin b-like [Ricinus communis]|eukprot:XP_015576304.1 nigrin b-like [Ricinus communis]
MDVCSGVNMTLLEYKHLWRPIKLRLLPTPHVRDSLIQYGDDRSHNIRILNPASSLIKSQRFATAPLEHLQRKVVQLAVDVANVNIVGYLARKELYFFSNAPTDGLNNNFKGTDEPKLLLGGSYSDLECVAGIESRKNTIFIGMSHLNRTIESLYNTDSTAQSTLAKHLIVIIQMISE